jgi:NAD(P)-dependent dehydrogenase (short-subunit alcohol dehydrogenase family)
MSSDIQEQGRVAVITAVSSGIGAATARALPSNHEQVSEKLLSCA